MAKLNVGTHVSIAGSLDQAIHRAAEVGCTTFQIFTRNPRGWASAPISDGVRDAFAKGLRSSRLSPVVDHMPYLPNLASPTPDVRSKSIGTFKAEILRCDRLGIPFLVTHLGSHLGTGIEAGRSRIVAALNEALAMNAKCMVLLENTAGQKNSLGTTFGDLLAIIEKVDSPERIGICLDTCHAFVAGYDVKKRFSEVLDELDSAVGIERLKVIHLNDTIGGISSHLDRHYHIGLGEIGEDGFRNILADERIHQLPLIMETPIDEKRDDRGNIAKVHELAPK